MSNIPLAEVYLDLHVHLGWAGEPGAGVKISAARDLTLAAVLKECRDRKGIGMIGVIDAATDLALADLDGLLASGMVAELPGGGLGYGDEVTLIPGSEVEVTHEVNGRPLHLTCFLPGSRELREFAAFQRTRVRNPRLSTQRHHGTTASDVVAVVAELGGIVIPAHIFTPFKSVLGAAARVCDAIDPGLWGSVPAVELGLSADTELADELPELSHFTYVSNSDAHSLGKIGREYNRLEVASPTFTELVMALREEGGRRVAANFGLEPRLGKYHRTYCLDCDQRVEGEPPVLACPVDRRHKLVLGVLDRIRHYKAHQAGQKSAERVRPTYVHQVPLQFVPGLGQRNMARLLDAFGTEMTVLHRATELDLVDVVGERLARLVVGAREGTLVIESGGGGVYGKVLGE